MNYSFDYFREGSDLTDAEFKLIIEALETTQAKNYLEVGVWHGVNIYKIAKLLKFNGISLNITGFDCFNNNPNDDNSHVSGWPDIEIAQNLLQEFNVELISGFTRDIKNHLTNRKYDVVFHDANHTFEAVKNDLISIRDLIHQNSLVVVHNSHADIPERNFYGKSAINFLVENNIYKLEKVADSASLLYHA